MSVRFRYDRWVVEFFVRQKDPLLKSEREVRHCANRSWASGRTLLLIDFRWVSAEEVVIEMVIG